MRTPSVLMPRSTSQRRTGPATAPIEFWWNARLLGELGVGRDQRAAHDVGVAAEVLGGRVHDDVGAELERLLQVRRGEGVVDHQQRPGLAGEARPAPRCRRRRAAGWSASRTRDLVRGRSAARTASGSPSGTAVYSRPQAAEHLGDQPEGAAVRVARQDHVVAGPADRAEQGVLGGQPAGEGQPAGAALERGQGLLQRGAGRVGRCGCTRSRRAARRRRPACRSRSGRSGRPPRR